ncbi:hypothetical protein Cni_G27294 [Canna indica]|uniref:phospholipase A2 n=1 Tax=Canna indica TaxID=4628 RepID=A0AAQ3L7K7_9LILI|nr:hypothetical protein Cni_G27294 [Canna indica]
MEMNKRSVLVILFLLNPFLGVLLSSSPVKALNIGVQSANHVDVVSESKQQCSRKCESQHCHVPPFLKYGKYCGILYTGCPGEKPCDAIDACCLVHDSCVESKNNDYLSQECNANFLNCILKVKESGKASFKGSNCTVEEVVDVMTVVMEAALFAGGVLHNP